MQSDDFVERLSAPTPVPGGGAAAARVGSFACALLRMVTGITLRKAPEAAKGTLEEVSRRAEQLAREFQRLEAQDADAFELYLKARRSAREAQTENGPGETRTREALRDATEVSLAMIARALDLVRWIETTLALEPAVRIAARSDLFAALALAEATVRIASSNALENCAELGPEATAATGRVRMLVGSFDAMRDRIAARR